MSACPETRIDPARALSRVAPRASVDAVKAPYPMVVIMSAFSAGAVSLQYAHLTQALGSQALLIVSALNALVIFLGYYAWSRRPTWRGYPTTSVLVGLAGLLFITAGLAPQSTIATLAPLMVSAAASGSLWAQRNWIEYHITLRHRYILRAEAVALTGDMLAYGAFSYALRAGAVPWPVFQTGMGILLIACIPVLIFTTSAPLASAPGRLWVQVAAFWREDRTVFLFTATKGAARSMRLIAYVIIGLSGFRTLAQYGMLQLGVQIFCAVAFFLISRRAARSASRAHAALGIGILLAGLLALWPAAQLGSPVWVALSILTTYTGEIVLSPVNQGVILHTLAHQDQSLTESSLTRDFVLSVARFAPVVLGLAIMAVVGVAQSTAVITGMALILGIVESWVLWSILKSIRTAS